MKRPARTSPSHDEAIDATAAAWLAQRDGGFTPDDERAFAQWRGADPRHEAAVVRLEQTWAALRQLHEFRPAARMHPDRDLLRSRAKPRRPALRTLPIFAAAAALVLVAVWWFAYPKKPSMPSPQDYATTVDGYQRVVLADGSVVELNASSEVRVHFSPAERRVRLVRGEAHFTVAKNRARPFWVEAGAVAVRAVGTAFNVRLGDTKVEVLVTEGKVQVGQQNPPADGTRPEAPPGDAAWADSAPPVLVEANERAVIRVERTPAAPPAPAMVEKVSAVAIREALAWQGPRLVFADTPLAEVVARFNERNRVQLVLADPELGSIPVGGSFRAENLDAFVRLMAQDGGIAVEYPDSGHIVLRRRK